MLHQASQLPPGSSHTFAKTTWDLELRLQAGHDVERVTIVQGARYDRDTQNKKPPWPYGQ